MELLECLVRTPGDQLQRMADQAGLAAVGDRRILERELTACLTDPAWLQGQLADLSDEQWAALKVVFFNGGAQGITVELCHQIVNLVAGRRRKASARAVEDLLDRGLIYQRAHNYRQVFFIPMDLLTVLGEILSRQMIYRVGLDPATEVALAPMHRDLLEEAHRFLAYVYKTDIALTQQGLIFKRHLRGLLELLGTEEDDEDGLAGRYPEPLGMLMGFALDRHLIVREDGRLQTSPLLHQWVDRPAGAKQLDLFQYWQDRYAYQDLQTFVTVMQKVGREWVSVDKLVSELEPMVNPSQRGSFLLRLKHHCFQFLGPMGLVELATLPSAPVETDAAPEPDLACRLTEGGLAVLDGRVPEAYAADSLPLILQATFEIIAPRPVDARSLWLLELIGDLEASTDRTLRYRLSRPSIYRGLKSGLSGEAILDFLRAHSAAGVPQNVAFDLKAWAASYGQVYLQAVTLLRCATPALAEHIRASRRTARFVVGELSPTDLIVEEASWRDLLEALEADGLMPRPGIERPVRDEKKQDAR